MARGLRFRGWVMLWALLQFALPTVATYADALLERAGARAASHIESGSDTSCVPVHPADCAFCHAVQRMGAPSEGVAVLADVLASAALSASAARVPDSVERGRLPLSRAPPTV